VPQISLYVDKSMMRKIEEKASQENKSISKFISNALDEHFSRKWPESWPQSFLDAFGAGGEAEWDLHEPEELDWSLDAARAEL
jgi:hypothetical protein